MKISKRQYMKATGASLVALSLGATGALASVAPQADDGDGDGGSASGETLDYERDGDDNIEFDYNGVTFETKNNDADVELMVDNGVSLDFESDDSGADLEMMLETNGEMVDLEASNGDVELMADDDLQSLDDGNDLEYRGSAIQLEWDDENDELDITGDVTLEYDGTELEYRDDEVRLEWEAGADFEARRV
jgi:hypothetical protein